MSAGVVASHITNRTQHLFWLSALRDGRILSRMNPQVSIETATQLAVFLGNRPGALSRVCTELAAAEVNIHALAISDTVDHAVVRMVVSDPTKALMILGERGVLALENDVLMMKLKEHQLNLILYFLMMMLLLFVFRQVH